MKFFIKVFLIIATCFLASCASNIDNGPRSSSVSSAESSLERGVLKEVNAIRARHGLKSLSYHKGLSVIGRRHSDFMMKNKGRFNLLDTNITHQGYSDRRSQAAMLYNFESVSENVVYTSVKGNLASHIVKSWMDSPGHRIILLSKSASVGGMGIRNDGGEVFGTLLVAERSINNIPAFVGPQGF